MIDEALDRINKDLQLVRAPLSSRGIGRLLDDLREVRPFGVESELPLLKLAGEQEVVDEPGELMTLLRDHVEHPRLLLRAQAVAALLHGVDAGNDGGQG